MYGHLSSLVGALFFLGGWGILFARARRSRKPMLWASAALGHIGPLSEYWHARDYWSPAYSLKVQLGDWTFGLEAYFFAFAFAGLCAGVFDLLVRRAGQPELVLFDGWGFVGLMLLGFACLLSMSVLVVWWRLNSLHAFILIFLAGAALILGQRRAWLTPAVQTAFLAAAAMWIFYAGFFLRLFPGIVDAW
jgi:hypothetical protein